MPRAWLGHEDAERAAIFTPAISHPGGRAPVSLSARSALLPAR
jgi:hypothetical protein